MVQKKAPTRGSKKTITDEATDTGANDMTRAPVTSGTADTGETNIMNAKTQADTQTMKDVETHLAERNLPTWMWASIMVYAGWKSGKQVTADEFDAVVTAWNTRKQGSGRRA